MFFRLANPSHDYLTWDFRVRPERVMHAVRGEGTAELTLRWAPHLVGGATVEQQLSETTIRDRYGPGVRCAVGIAPPVGGDLTDMTIIAHGYIDAPRLNMNGDVASSFIDRKLMMRDIINHAGRRDAAHVYGRYMLSLAGWEHARDNPEENPIDIAWAALAKRVQSAPCIFNPKGSPNRYSRLALLNDDDTWTTGPFHLFTYDGDPAAEYWTYLQALRYLVLLHLPWGLGEQVGPGDLFTETLAGPAMDPWYLKDEPDVALAGALPNGWLEHMTRRCQSLALEGMDLIEAITALCDAAGVDWYVRHSNESTADECRVLSDLAFAAPGDIAPDPVMLEEGGGHFDVFSGALRSMEEITDANNVQHVESAREYGAAVSRVRVLGDRVWRTITTQLVPLWIPDPIWDAESPDVAALLIDAIGEEWTSGDPPVFEARKDGTFHKRFCAGGAEFEQDSNAIIGRKWGIDTAGLYDDATYGRPNFPAYGDPFEIPGAADEAPRWREIREVPAPEGQHPIGVYVEVSFDGTEEAPTWYPLKGEVRVFPGEAALYITGEDLLRFASSVLSRKDPDTEETLAEQIGIANWYHSYLLGEFRIRATFQIEMDHRVEQVVDSADSPLLPEVITAQVSRERDLAAWFQDGGVNATVLARMATRNDYDSAERFARAMLRERAYATWSGRIGIPWLETERYPLATPIEGIKRAGGAVDIKFGGSALQTGKYPRVIKKVYTQSESEVSTALVLEDHRFARGLTGRRSD